MKAVKAALYSRMTGDPTLMGRLGNRGPFLGRLPNDSPHSRTLAAISYQGETAIARGDKESQTYTIDVWAYSHDLIEDVAADLDRLFVASPRRHWVSLPVAGGPRAMIRREFAIDLPDVESELWHRAIRFRVLFARAA